MKNEKLPNYPTKRKPSEKAKRNFNVASFNVNILVQKCEVPLSSRIEDIVKKEFSKIRKG
ncbi:hypothetical protein BAY06_04670 [Elizabethkingia anophelis]|nr:hypothetical protein BAY06_04670 [Elizabethkingia anophelis]